MSEGAAELEKVLIAPPVHYGWGPHHMAYKGIEESDRSMMYCRGPMARWPYFEKLSS